MNSDKMKITILPEGTLKLEVEGAISDANHLQAEGLVRRLAERLGGTVEVTQKQPDHSHGHGHGHSHGQGGQHQH